MRGKFAYLALTALLAAAVMLFIRDKAPESSAEGSAVNAMFDSRAERATVTGNDTFSPGTRLFAAEQRTGSVPDSLHEALQGGRRNAIVRAAERVGPAVVSVSVIQTRVVTRAVRDFFGYFYVPSQRQVENLGSGFIFNSRGYILTNQHVVEHATEITISTSAGDNYPATLVGEDRNTDLAVLKIEPGNLALPSAPLGDSDDLHIGEWAIAIGSPFGLLLDDPQPTVTVGVISAVGRDIRPDRSTGGKVYANMIQTDAAINPGNSGGPLLNALGEVIGINTFIFSQSGGSVGMGFAIPINRARRIAEDLIRGGKVLHPWIGIKVQDLGRDILRSMGYDAERRIQGVLVADIQPFSPAAASKRIEPGDILTRLNGQSVRSSDDWTGRMLDVRVGEPIELEILREGRELRTTVIPVQQPTDKAERYRTGLGFTLIDLTPEVKSQLEARSESGAVIAEIENADLIDNGTLLPFDVLYRIGNAQITGAEQAVKLLSNIPRGKYAILLLERDGRSIRRYISG